MSMHERYEIHNEAGDVAVALVVCSDPGAADVTSGPADNWSPGWGPEFEIESWTLNGAPIDQETLAAKWAPFQPYLDEIQEWARRVDWEADGPDPDELYEQRRDDEMFHRNDPPAGWDD